MFKQVPYFEIKRYKTETVNGKKIIKTEITKVKKSDWDSLPRIANLMTGLDSSQI